MMKCNQPKQRCHPDRPLTIAMVTNNYKPYQGGVVSSIDAFTAQLVRLGQRVLIITLDFGVPEVNLVTDNPKLIRLSCPFKWRYRGNWLAWPWRPVAALLQICQAYQVDLIHSHHPFLLGQTALKVARQLQLPLIFTYHSQYDKFTHNVPLPRIWLDPWANRCALTYAQQVDHVIAPSMDLQRFLLLQGLTVSITVLPSEILPVFWSEQIDLRRLDMPLRLLTVSRFAREKNIYFLLDMFAILVRQVPATLTLVGHGHEYPKLVRYVQQQMPNLLDRIKFVLAPPKPEIARLYRDHQIFVFASQSETQGLVLAEAMAAGLPVVALNGPGQRDIIANGQNGFLVASQSEMVAKLVFLGQQPALFTQFQIKARATASYYVAPNLTRKLLNIYKQS